MKIVLPTFLLAIGFSAVQAKSVYLRPDEADEKSQLARRKLRRALQTDSSMSLPELTQQTFGKAFKDAPVAPEETDEEEVVDATEEEVVDATEEEVATTGGKAAKEEPAVEEEPEEAAEEVDDEEEVPAVEEEVPTVEEEVPDAPADEEEEEVPASDTDTPTDWGTKASKVMGSTESHPSMESGKTGKAVAESSHPSMESGKTGKAVAESHHSLESEWSGSSWSGSSWSGKSGKKSDLKYLIKFIIIKILVLLDILSFEEAAALVPDYSKPSLGSIYSGKSGKSGHYGGKGGKSGLKDEKEDILELLGIFLLWLESLDKAAIEGYIISILGELAKLDKAAIEGFIMAGAGIVGLDPTGILWMIGFLEGMGPQLTMLTELQTVIGEEDLPMAYLSMP